MQQCRLLIFFKGIIIQVKFSLVKHKNGGESTHIAGSTEPVKTTIFLTNESKEIKADIARYYQR